MRKNPKSSEYQYRCKVCGTICIKKKTPWGLSKTKLGHYGDGTPATAACTETLYTASTLSFTAASGDDPATINDSQSRFADNCIREGMSITVATGSGTNDGDYTIATRGVSRGEIRLVSTDSLTTEDAATAGEVSITRNFYKPNVTRGCPLCGSLNSK